MTQPVPDPDPTPDPPEEPPIEGSGPLIDDPKKLYELYATKKSENEALRRRLQEAEKGLEQLNETRMTETEKLVSQARKDAAEEIRSEYAVKLVNERLARLAAGRLQDPADAARHIDTSQFTEDDEGAMEEAILGLIDAKPYLATAGSQRVPSVDQGPRGVVPQPNGMSDTPNEWLRAAIGQP